MTPLAKGSHDNVTPIAHIPKPRRRVYLGPPDWPIGSTIYRGDEPNLRVVDTLPPDTPEDFAILVVEEE